MKKLNTAGISSAVLIMLAGMIFILQSCDLTSQEESFKNPYTEETNQVFNEVSESVFGNVADNIKDKAYGTVTREDIMQYANEGYRQWAQKNGAVREAFNSGVKAYERLQQLHIKNNSSIFQMTAATTDSLLNELELTHAQKNYILKLPEIISKSGNIARLGHRLEKFDEKVYEKLGKEDSKPVLKMSAIMKSSMGYLTTNAKMLAMLGELVEENSEQSYFYRPSLENKRKNLFELVQSQEGPTDPPSWDNYYNAYDMASATLGGAATGAGLLGQIGAGVGTPFFGIFGSAVGAVIGGFTGAFLGGGAAGGLEFQSQVKEYEDDVESWCDQEKNEGHEYYDTLCGDNQNDNE